MDTLEAIFTRRSVSKVLPDPIPHALVEQVLLAAAQAPNHYKVRPWHFVVLYGAARERLGQVMADSLQAHQPDLPPASYEKERQKPLRAPVVIAVGVDRPEDARVIEVENICATAAAVQNLLLAAHALGLGAIWRTGPAAYDPAVKTFLGFAPEQHLVAFVYLGLPAALPAVEIRHAFDDRTVWMA
jgi:nitroreductase